MRPVQDRGAEEAPRPRPPAPSKRAGKGRRDPALADPLRRLLDAVSHEMRSPLNTIQSWSHVLENELARAMAGESGREHASDPTIAVARALAGIRTGVREQARLIDQLLDASRAMSGTLVTDQRPMLVLPSLEAAVAGAQATAAGRRMRIVTDYAAADARVDGDGERLRKAFALLLANAIKFSWEGGDIRVSLRRHAGSVLIAVSDSGQGIDADFLPRMFGWFQRADRGRQGLGLGLALVRRFCEMQGGDVEARSDGPGRGATFTIRLPELASTRLS